MAPATVPEAAFANNHNTAVMAHMAGTDRKMNVVHKAVVLTADVDHKVMAVTVPTPVVAMAVRTKAIIQNQINNLKLINGQLDHCGTKEVNRVEESSKTS